MPSRATTALGWCHEKAHATGGHHADYAVDGNARERFEQAKLEMQTSADEPCSPPGPRPKVGWPTEAKARWISKREDDPEEESPQSNDETAEESRSLMTRPRRNLPSSMTRRL